MTDIVSKKKRSEIMSAVKSKDSRMELSLRKELSKRGIRYRKHVSRLPGTPDIAFISKKIAVFLDSCFWHGCRWHGTMPATNRKFWKEKIAKNRERDKRVNKKYKKMGWQVLRFWEHDLKKDFGKAIYKIIKAIK